MMRMHNATWIAALVTLFAFGPWPAHAQPLPKVGTCPIDYHPSGGACVPNAAPRTPTPAIAKTGQCPVGYRVSGDYCLGYPGAKHAIPRTGSCPADYHASGAYCLSNR
jgi:hypothetical protein